VINSILCTADTGKVYLSYSYPSFSQPLNEVPFVNKITISNTTNTFEFNKSKESNGKAIYKGQMQPQPGVNYQLSVELPDGEILTAYCSIPKTVEIDSFYLQKAIPEYDGDQPYDMKIRFSDPLGESNYYLVGFSIFKSNQKYFYDPVNNFAEPEYGFVYNEYYFLNEANVNLNINEPLIGGIEYYYPHILTFNDKQIDGKTYTLTIGLRDILNNSFAKAFLFIPKLYAISSDTYFYYQSINKASDNNESFISEPIVQYSNINGSIGIFGGMAMSTDTLFITKVDLLHLTGQ
jgi:hypothetical protein